MMITIDKIKIYERYHGYYDGYFTQFQLKGQFPVSDNEWTLIGDLLHEIFLLTSKMTSKSFNENLDRKLVLYCVDIKTIDYLKKLDTSKW